MADYDTAVKLYGLATCDTCRKAARALADGGVTVTRQDVRADPLTPEQLARFLAAFGDALLNRKSTTWRGLDPSQREALPADLLATHPALMKRPVIDGPGGLTLGWGDDARAKHLG